LSRFCDRMACVVNSKSRHRRGLRRGGLLLAQR
jgi:hypothetical protein